jgi:hypothetical protein
VRRNESSEDNHVVSVDSYFGDMAVAEVRNTNGGKEVTITPVSKDERTPPQSDDKE